MVTVDDLHAALVLVVELGGKIVMEPVTIPTVCELAWIEVPSANTFRIATYV
jgi:predicted enzyme related to lactoylglutathione lyase